MIQRGHDGRPEPRGLNFRPTATLIMNPGACPAVDPSSTVSAAAQGTNAVRGSGMSGHGQYAVLGIVVLLIGSALLAWARRIRRRRLAETELTAADVNFSSFSAAKMSR